MLRMPSGRDMKLQKQSEMKLEHIALTIVDQADIESFYQNILGTSVISNFVLEKDLARQIFEINRDTPVFLMKNDNLLLELFISPERNQQDFKHICISIENRKELAEKAIQDGYECIQLRREKSELIFIKDRSGNIFEIKEEL